MFRFCRLDRTKENKGIPKGYCSINLAPGYSRYYSWGTPRALVCKNYPTFDQMINCLKKAFVKNDYIGCYSLIYWKYYREFYEWIKESFEKNDAANIKIIKRFYHKSLVHWVMYTSPSKNASLSQKEHFRMMNSIIFEYYNKQLINLFDSPSLRKEEDYYRLFHTFLSDNQAKIISFHYDYECFGNIFLLFEYDGQMYNCVLDRDEIRLIEESVCDYSYSRKTDPKEQMMKIIEEKVFCS